MCGIVGFFAIDSSKIDLDHMISLILHRGPDGTGKVVGDDFGLGHARLAIIDLEGGHQPMLNEDRSVIVVGNHEIYNFPVLRKELEGKGHRFVTRSDTEVIIHGYEEWGEKCFEKFEGMFAVAIIDKSRKRCLLGRDHIGIKFLLYAEYQGGWVFASEAKAILALPEFRREVNTHAFHLFMNFRYVPNEETLFAGIHKIPQGHYAVLEPKRLIRLKRYYAIEERGRNYSWKDPREAQEALEKTFSDAVRRHLISDVPVGIYLSGGIDSSLTASFAAAENRGIQSFCMMFGEPSDEHRDAERVAQHVGCHHRNLYVGDMPLSLLPEVIWHVEEPKVNCIQGYLLSREVCKYVKVALSGMGGDELFAGYTNNDFLYPMTLFSRIKQVSPRKSWYASISALRRRMQSLEMDHYYRMMDLMASLWNPVMYYSILRNSFDHSQSLMEDIYGNSKSYSYAAYHLLSPQFKKESKDILGELLVLEMSTKMVNDFLLTDDRVSMANGLEVRVPFLDKQFMDVALSIPTGWKYSLTNKKKILKEIVKNRLPDFVRKKKKWGFSFNPYYQFSKDLKVMAENELTLERVHDLGWFNYSWIRRVLDHPPSPRLRWHYFNLWVMLGFSVWHRLFIEDFVPHGPSPLGVKK